LIRLRSSASLTAALLAGAAALPACVIPVGPNFTDPVTTPDAPPYFVKALPNQGSLVVGPQSFQVWVTDQNPSDDLTVRWFADFPPVQGNTRPIGVNVGFIPASADGTVQTTLLEADVDCATDNLAPAVDQHTITVVVSNSKGITDLTTTPFDGSHEVTATWSLLLQCRSSNGP
jgi:hypothetical protein